MLRSAFFLKRKHKIKTVALVSEKENEMESEKSDTKN